MIRSYGELIVFVVVLLAFALAIILPFVWFLIRKSRHDRDMADSCHEFQRELNRQTLVGFNRNSDALNLNTQALTAFMAQTVKNDPPPAPRVQT